MRKGVVVDLDETVKSIEAATEKRRADGRRPCLARLRRHHRRAHPQHQQPRRRRRLGRGARGLAGRRPARASTPARSSTSPPTGKSSTRCRATLRSTGRTASRIRSGWPAAGSRWTRTSSPAARASSPTCSSACIAPASKPAGMVFEPLASSAATLLTEEKQVGVVLLDIGGGTTDIAVYSRRRRGLHVDDSGRRKHPHQRHRAGSEDDARPKPRASRSAYGCGVLEDGEADETFSVTTLDGRTTSDGQRAAQLRAIIVPRVARNLPDGAKRRSRSACRAISCSAEVVITGGGAHLHGIEAAARTSSACRCGSACRRRRRTTDAMKQPQYSTAIGLVMFGPKGDGTAAVGGRSGSERPGTRRELAERHVELRTRRIFNSPKQLALFTEEPMAE